MINISTDLIGYTGTVVGTLIMLPQVIKVFRTKKTEDVSVLMTILYLLNCVLWLWYGHRIHAAPVMVANGAGGVIGTILFVLKLKYDTHRKEGH